tara:strand:- start:251 stop:550 length:300 start_codon:yes stop_codon:yes gene_type:complete
MMQGKAPIIIAIMLIISFAAGFILRPIILPPSRTVSVNPVAVAPAPARATQYFAANLDEARRVVAGCRAGSMRGDECANAEQAVTEAEGHDRFKKFMGH